MGQTFVEKIFSKKLGRKVKTGDIVEVTPDVAMSHDNTAAIIGKFKELGEEKVHNPDRHVIILDHATPPPNETYAANQKIIREFVAAHGIKNFFDVNTGICHQVLPEQGFALPGKIIVGSDSHTTTYGAFGAFSTGIGRSEMAVIFATGKIWFRIPESMKITVNGTLQQGITAKDMMLHIIGDLSADGALYRSVEFYGEVISGLSIGSRMTVANMVVEMGAKNGFLQPDRKLFIWLNNRARGDYEVIMADKDACYEKTVSYDVSDLEPQIACPHSVDNIKRVSEITGTKINQAFLGSCANGRLEDLKVAASLIKGKRVHPAVRFLVFPASMNIYRETMTKGYLDVLSNAGAIIMNPGCGPCLGAHSGVLAAGEVCISSSNRNFKGRMGSQDAAVYLGSPASVTASAIAGEIVDFRKL
ncbi:MAG: 3-isopropylmalate dehydratase large subunit [Deltaproteobacteria bacterium]|nr:3-isopropylmalate dehydratase large subunit [Deltaproteobacteria bacterium]MBW1994023.1 3-isopropylmalate dehydratase large subunit [Deltaproteobacteria bacterium]MBW2150496.1 3-isopropylmalate dehydratase large subunit [Deltaproteobacteria bacterium]